MKFLTWLKRDELTENVERKKFLSQATEPGNDASYSATENWSFKIKQANYEANKQENRDS